MASAEDSLHFDDEIDKLLSVETDTGTSFTALLELPTNKAVQLLQFPFQMENQDLVKEEPVYSYSQPDSSPVSSDPVNLTDNVKRKPRETKVKRSAKKCKIGASETLVDAENLPYVHVRARRGQATDSHSLAERARREKINARMKLLQELVPGCTKISGTAMVLDEIINHVHSLQRQVELLSMRLATVNPRINVHPDNLLPGEGMFMPPPYELEGNGYQYQQIWHTEGLHQPFTLDHSVNPGFDFSGSLHLNQLKMEQ
jgi:hypothetical protein